MARRTIDFPTLIEALCRHEVEFIVVGGVSAVLQGAPLATFDLDLVHSRTAENVRRLIGALREMDARDRDAARRRFDPTGRLLSGEGHHLLMTAHGPLDLLGRIGREETYDTLVSQSIEVELGARRVRVLDLEALIRIKEEVGQEKDRPVLPILKRLLEERG